jgi:signal transduction histidine kinase
MTHRNTFPAGWARRAWSWAHALSWRRDLLVPFVVLVVQLAATAAISGHVVLGHRFHAGPLGWVLVVAGPLALVARRRHPVAALWVSAAATFAPATSGFTYLAFVVAFFAAVMAGKRHTVWLVVALQFACSVWFVPLAYGQAALPLNDAIALGGWQTALVLMAEATRLQRDRAAQARDASQADQRRRQSEERLQVARDLHDVVGHNISLINVQANVGLKLLDSEPESVRAALGAIKAASKEALEELRTMLSALRRDEDAAPRSPAPGLDRLRELVELTRAAGLGVDLELADEASGLPPAVQLAAYRILQESLTNVTRHAGPARASVRVAYDGAALVLEVTDDGTFRPAGDALTGSGSGIAGMRERVTALGGELSAGPRPGGGFAVRARLPVRPAV